MPNLPGTWAPPTLEGDRIVWLDGVLVHVPDHADLKLVHAHHRITILHCRVDERVYVLSAMGQLQEDDDAARRRALPTQWAVIAGDWI